MSLIALSYHDRYLAAEGGGDDLGEVHANRTAIGPWEKWKLRTNPDGTVSLQSDQGRYLSAESGGGAEAHANRMAIGPWECFQRTQIGDTLIAFKTVDGAHFLGVTGELVDARSTVPVYFTQTILEASLSPIHVDGIDFRDAQNQRWIWRGFTDFLLYWRYLTGQPIDDLLTERANLGANLVRVLGMVDWGPLRPTEHGDYYDKLAPFVDSIAAHGLYVEFTVFADAQVIMPRPDQQQAHFTQVCDRLRGRSNVFVELANEFPKNGINPADFSAPEGIVSAHGSGLGDGMPAQPGWSYTTFHCRRDYPKLLLDAQPIELIYGWEGFPGFHHPVVGDEPIGADEVDQPGRRSVDPNLFFKMGVLHGLWNGGTFHSEDGIHSQPLRSVQRACALTFFKGLRATEGVA
jgi:hypothetical protein